MTTKGAAQGAVDIEVHKRANRRVLWIAFGTGFGLMGALDAIAFHHLLRWHNFYIHAGADWRAKSDGLLHVVPHSATP
jgi:uncharacterized membrane protein